MADDPLPRRDLTPGAWKDKGPGVKVGTIKIQNIINQEMIADKANTKSKPGKLSAR